MHALRRAGRQETQTRRVPSGQEGVGRSARRSTLPTRPADVALALQARIGNAEVLLRIQAGEEGGYDADLGVHTGNTDPGDRGSDPGGRGSGSGPRDRGSESGGRNGGSGPHDRGSDPGRTTGRSRPALPKARVRAGEDAGGIEGTWMPGPEPSRAPSGVPRDREKGSAPRARAGTDAAAAATTLALSPEGGAPKDLVGQAGEAFQAGLLRSQEREAACREAHEDAGRRFGGGFFGSSVGTILREDAQREMLVHARVGRIEDILGTTLVTTLQTAAQAWDVRDEVLGCLAASGLADIGEDGQVCVASGAIAAKAVQARRQLGPAADGLEAQGSALQPGPEILAGIAEVQATRAALGAALDRARARAVDASVNADREERAKIRTFIDLCDDVEKTSVLLVGLAGGLYTGAGTGKAISDAGAIAGGDLGYQANSAAGLAAETIPRPRLDELQARIGAATALSDTLGTVAAEGDLAGRQAAFEAAVLGWSASLASARSQADRQVHDLAALGLLVDLASGRPAKGPGGLGQDLADLARAAEAARFAAAVAPPLSSISDRLSAFHDEATRESAVPAGLAALNPLRRALAEEGDLAQVWAREARRLSGEADGTRAALVAASAFFEAPDRESGG